MFTKITNFLNTLSRFPALRDFPLEICSLSFSLDRLLTGVDNVRYDVYLSEGFYKAAVRLIIRLLSIHIRFEEMPKLDKSSDLPGETKEFKRLCREIMLDGVNKAKLNNEIQIDFLVQIAVIKMLREEIPKQYEIFIERIKDVIREYEISRNQDKAILLKKRLAEILQNKKSVLQKVGTELFQFLSDVQNYKNLKEIRELNFGTDAVLPDFIFSNPMLYAENVADDFFMLEEYGILLGRRLEDPDQYDALLFLIKQLLIEADMKRSDEEILEARLTGDESCREMEDIRPDAEEKIDGWLKHTDNVDILFNYFDSQARYTMLRKQKKEKAEQLSLRQRIRDQKKLLKFFYKHLNKESQYRLRNSSKKEDCSPDASFETDDVKNNIPEEKANKNRRGNFIRPKTGLIEKIVAVYEMQPIYTRYCPPLVPQLVLQFLVSPRIRKRVENRLKRLKQFYGRAFSLKPLWEVIRRLKKINMKTRRMYLIRFLSAFIRYHRDFKYFQMVRSAADNINLLMEEKLINLSRVNNTLYEFLLPDEQASHKKPIINHVIIKADVRGSTDMTHRMLEKGLNPASHFSLNFFDPITDILSEYGASKVFVEGDAIILSIFEREKTPQGWYSVARACGLAMDMLDIVRRYNIRNRKNQLPIIELGIGICHRESVPMFLFDGNNRIMISSAINLADRLSGCSKPVRKKMADYKGLFNLYLFQTVSDKEIEATADDLFLRYNVNGIQLNAEGFEKLSKEIDLKTFNMSFSLAIGGKKGEKEKIKLHTGKFPTATGNYQYLIIRESNIPRVNPDNLEIIRMTPRKYYEVCTNPKVYEYIRKLENNK